VRDRLHRSPHAAAEGEQREWRERQLTTQLRELCEQWDVPPRCVVVAVRTDALLAAATAAGCLTLEHCAAADHVARKARVRPSLLSATRW
jgi:hypothetical protein